VYLADGAAEDWVIYPTTKTTLVHSADSVRRVAWDYQIPLLPGLILGVPVLFD